MGGSIIRLTFGFLLVFSFLTHKDFTCLQHSVATNLKKSGAFLEAFLEGGEIHDATCEKNYVSNFIAKPLEDPNPIRFCTSRKSQHPLNWHKWIINMVTWQMVGP
jgi:hypothetical protein